MPSTEAETMANTEIRPRLPSDIPPLIEALKDVYRTDGYPVEGTSTAAVFLSPPGLVEAWVALHAGVVVGQVAVIAGVHGDQAAVRAWVDIEGGGGDVEHTVVAARFFIRRSARGMGLGRGLVERTCDWAKQNGMRIVMNVLDKDQDAMRLYEKARFSKVGEGIYENQKGEKFKQYFYVYGCE
ncbi:acyl-CoA N-acyltransferase [Xylariales sp. AK1849]|nr:acyl-CoA N-acyltransferase [Xylariales sp. AK1849]